MNKKNSFEVFEYNKKSSLNFIKSQGKRLGHWEEKFLSSNYWKNWSVKIQEFQDQDEMDFYTDRLRALIDFIFNNGMPVSDSRLIQQEEQRLQNISVEDFKKEDRFSNAWEELGKEMDAKWIRESLEKAKSGSISYIKEKNELNRWDIYHAHWETYLTSHVYWKNWQAKINSFQDEKEISFYTDRLSAFIDFVKDNTRKDIPSGERVKQWDPLTTPQIIDQELKRLENISEEEFNKTDKWRSSGAGLKELSIGEMLNDPWFSKQIGNIFGLENGKNKEKSEKESFPVKNQESEKAKIYGKAGELKEKDGDKSENKRDKKFEDDYKSWTQEQLISEINRLKVENEELKNNQTLTSSEKQERLRQNQQKLEQISGYVNADSKSNNFNNNFPTGLVVGGGALAVIGLVSILVIRKYKEKSYGKK